MLLGCLLLYSFVIRQRMPFPVVLCPAANLMHEALAADKCMMMLYTKLSSSVVDEVCWPV